MFQQNAICKRGTWHRSVTTHLALVSSCTCKRKRMCPNIFKKRTWRIPMHLLNHMVGNQVPPSILSVKRPASHQRSRTSRTHSCLQSLGMCVAALVFSTCVPPLSVLPHESFGQVHADYNSPIKNHNITRSEWYDRQYNWDKKELIKKVSILVGNSWTKLDPVATMDHGTQRR